MGESVKRNKKVSKVITSVFARVSQMTEVHVCRVEYLTNYRVTKGTHYIWMRARYVSRVIRNMKYNRTCE